MAAALGNFLGVGFKASQGVVDFTNDVLNNIVSLTGDAHQSRIAQDIFRQEIRYERSLQMRQDIRDVNKVMLEGIASLLYLESIICATCFVSIIEGYPPVNSNRMVIAWYMLSSLWSITFTMLAIWFALSFQVKISAAARERLLRRYRYNLADDKVTRKLGGGTLINTFLRFNTMLMHQMENTLNGDSEGKDKVIKPRRAPESSMKVKVQSLDIDVQLDVAPLRKGTHAWLHPSGRGWAQPVCVDCPYFLLEETLVRCTWEFRGNRPLLLRVYGEATLYISSQCPPLGGALEEGNNATLDGIRKAIGAHVPEWPADELPIVTAGFHPHWRGPSGYGEFQRVDGFSILVDENNFESPIYKVVLASPGKDGYVDVIISWNFKETGCEALTVVLRQGQVHCTEEDWPIAEFNEEIRQLLPLQDFSGYFIRRGVTCLLVNVCLAVLSRYWMFVEGRSLWWIEIVMLAFILGPSVLYMYKMPINMSATTAIQTLSSVNKPPPFTNVAGLTAAKLWADGVSTPANQTPGSPALGDDPFKFAVGDDSSRQLGERQRKAGGSPSNPGPGEHSPDGSPTPGAAGSRGRPRERGNRLNFPSSNARRPEAGRPMTSSPARLKEKGFNGALTIDTSNRTQSRDASPGVLSRASDRTSNSDDDSPRSPGKSAINRRGRRLGTMNTGGLPKALGKCEPLVSYCCVPEKADAGADGRRKLRIDTRAHSEPPQGSQPAEGWDRQVSPGSPPRLPIAARDRTASPRGSPAKGSPPVQVAAAGKPQDGRRAPRFTSENSGVWNSEGEQKAEHRLRLWHWSDLPTRPPPVYDMGPKKKSRLQRWAAGCMDCFWAFVARHTPMRDGKKETLDEDPITRALLGLTHVLDLLVLISVFAVIASPFMDFFRAPVVLGPEIDLDDGRRLMHLDGEQPVWTQWQVTWPQLFVPTAAALALGGPSGGGLLHVAAGRVLRSFRLDFASGMEPLAGPLLLPEAARGLSVVGASLLLVGDEGVHRVAPARVGGRSEAVGSGGPLGELLAAVGTASGGPPLVRRHGLPPPTAAAATELPADGMPSAVAVVLACQRGAGLHLGAIVTNASSGGELRLLTKLEALGRPLGNVTGLHISAAGVPAQEPVLWAAGSAGVAALGLSSSRLLARFGAPRLLARRAGQGQDGGEDGGESGRVLALTGNASHLIALVAARGSEPTIFSAPYPALLGWGPTAKEL